MPQTRRVPELSRLNVLFCLLVVWIHVASQAVSTLDRTSWQFALVYIPQRLAFVAVPGFFLLSGLKLTLPRPEGAPFQLGRYWARRFRTILVPYLIAVTVYYLNFVRLHYFPFDLKDLLGYAVRGDLSSPFYFVVTLVQFTLLVPVFRWLASRWSPVILLPFALVLTLISSLYLQAILQFIDPQLTFRYGDRVFTSYLVYYLAGCCIGRRYDDFLRLLRDNGPLLAAMFVFFALWDGATSWALMAGVRSAPYAEPVHTLYILSAILFLFQRAAARRSPLPRPLVYVDRASFLIYLYHCLAIVTLDQLTARLGISRVSLLLLLRLVFVYTAAIGGAVLWQALWRRLTPSRPLQLMNK